MGLTVDPDIFDAVEFGDIDTVKMYWTEHIDINWQDALGRNLMMLAAYYGDEEIVRFLLTKQPDLTLKNNDGMTAIDIAKSKNQEVIYQLLNNFR